MGRGTALIWRNQLEVWGARVGRVEVADLGEEVRLLGGGEEGGDVVGGGWGGGD